MARRKPKFSLPESWSEDRKKRTLDLADRLDEAVWKVLAKRGFEDWHTYSIEGPEEILEDLKECFEYTPSKTGIRGTLQVRRLRAFFGEVPPTPARDDYVILQGERVRFRLFFSDLPVEVHEVYARLREDGLSKEVARSAAQAVHA